MNRTVGYCLLGLGAIIFILSYAQVRTSIGITLPSSVPEIYLVVVSIVILVIGAIIAFKNGRHKQTNEVPIYHGKHIVGYRRMGK